MYILVGEYPEDPLLIYEWLNLALKVNLSFNTSSPNSNDKSSNKFWGMIKSMFSSDLKITNKVFETIKSTKKMKEWKDKADAIGIGYEEMISEFVFMAGFNAIGGLSVTVISCLACYLRLQEDERQLLKEDVDRFLAATDYDEVFPTLKYVHSFYLEVMRMHPPVPSIYGRAKQDFKLQSTSGWFKIKKNDLLCASVFLIQRDPNLFAKPDTFMLNRPIDELEKYNFVFGGSFNSKSTINNHKCLGSYIASNIAKIFTIFLTKCICIPTKVPIHSLKNAPRLGGSDEPLKVLKFHYEK